MPLFEPDIRSIPNEVGQPGTVVVGAVIDFCGSTIPAGYLTCDGAAVSRTTYTALFTAIGTTWGVGDGSTTFNLPDFQTRPTIGDVTATPTLGSVDGVAVGSRSLTHSHSFSATTGAPSANIAATALLGSAASPTHTHSVSGTTGNATVPFAVVKKIIKV